MARQERIGSRRDADREDEDGGERRLRDEELRHPPDVAEDRPPLGDHAWTAPKSPRTSTRSATAFAICTPLPCTIARRAALSAGTSFTPSRPSPRSVRPGSAPRRSGASSRAGRDRSRTTRPRPGGAPHRSREAHARRPVPGFDPDVFGDCRDSCRRIPETTFSSTPCARKNSTVLRASGRRRSARTTRPRRAAGGALEPSPSRERIRALRERDDPPPGSRLGRRHTAERAGLEDFGGAQHVRRPVEPEPAPAPPRRTGLGVRRGTRPGKALAQRLDRRVAEAGGGRSDRGPEVVSSTPSAGTTRATRRLPSVSVPVLSRQMVSIDARDSMAFSCWRARLAEPSESPRRRR